MATALCGISKRKGSLQPAIGGTAARAGQVIVNHHQPDPAQVVDLILQAKLPATALMTSCTRSLADSWTWTKAWRAGW